MAAFITSELVANATAVLVSNTRVVSNASANACRITLAGLVLPTAYGSVNPAESVQVSLYVGANGLSNDVLVLTQTYPTNGSNWAAELFLGSAATVTSNLQIKATTLSDTRTILNVPAAGQVLSSPATNGVINIANTGCLLSVYVAAVGGGSNGSVTIETGAVANVTV